MSSVSPVVQVMVKQLLDNAVFITAGNPRISIHELNREQFKTVVDKGITGYVVNTFSDSEVYPVFIFYPNVFVKYFEKIYRKVHSGEIDPQATNSAVTVDLLNHITGNLPRLFYFTPVEENPSNEYGYELTPFFTLPKSYSSEDGEELMWRSGGCRIFQIRIDKVPCFAVIRNDVFQNVNTYLKKDPRFVAIVKEMVLSRDAGLAIDEREELESVTISILQPEDFLLGEFVLPFNCRCKDKEVGIVFQEMSIGNAVNGYKRSHSYRSRIVFMDNKELDFYYSSEREIKPLLSCFLRHLGVFYQKELDVKVKGIALKEINSADIDFGDGTIGFKTEISVLQYQFPLFVMCREDMFLHLLEKFLDPWEVELLKRNLKNCLLSLLSINQALTRKSPGRLSPWEDRGKADFGKGTVGRSDMDRFLKVSALLNSAPPEDIKRIIGRVGFEIIAPGLFYYSDGGEDSPLFKIADYDEEALLEYLPQAVRDEWNYRMMKGHSHSYDELVRLNVAFMLALAKLVYQKDIELSHDVREMVTRFYDKYERYYWEEVRGWQVDNDVFSFTDQFDKKIFPAFLSNLESRFLCLALIGEEDKIEKFRPFMSKFYFSDIEDRLKLLKKQFEKREFFIDEVFEAKKKFFYDVKYLAFPDEEER